MSQKSYITYVQFKLHITKSIGLTEPIPKNIVNDIEPKFGIGLGSHKKLIPIPTPEPENPKYEDIPSRINLKSTKTLHRS